MSYLASDFENVDGTHAAQKFTHCLRLLESLDFFQTYKQKTFDLLQLVEGETVLEVGCGTGEDAIALAKRVGKTGRVVAIDHSQVMLDQAIASTKELQLLIEFIRAEAQQLPFADKTFDAARVDRTLQHISEPERVVAEMTRVVRSGGRIVAMEPDWETFIVDSEKHAVTRKLLNFWCDSFPTGWVGRDLPKYFHHEGLTHIQTSPETLVIQQFDLADQVFDLVQTAHRAGEIGVVSQQEANEWLAELRYLDQVGEFFCSFTGFVVSGKKP
ncbi:MAG: class I SAM-dependent methyltransferase [Oscillatoriales cyanobacterium C42_A2020_001]|nr:class I SAM-dependent methyltransferase [Leptolyngbyaceae cyanobacterium C42_A2020_001]